MNITEYENIFTNEGTHFFYRSTHQLICTLLERYTSKKHLKLLDAGAGTGLLAHKLSNYGSVEAVDINLKAVQFAKKRGVKIVKGSVSKLPFASKTFDVVTCIDVLYHLTITNDITALQELYRVLKPNGVVIIRVPALSWLGTNHDAHVHTRHRYTLEELSFKAKEVGFKIECISYIHLLFIPFVLLKKLCEKVFPSPQRAESGVAKLTPFINKFFIYLVSWERFTIPYFSLPLGVGIIAVLRKS